MLFESLDCHSTSNISGGPTAPPSYADDSGTIPLYQGHKQETHYVLACDRKPEREVILRPCSPIINKDPKPKRNAPCPCGSGKKYKHCCNLN